MTQVPVTKCKPDPRLFYNRRWGKTSCSKKGNRKVYDFADYHSKGMTASWAVNYELDSVNTDMKDMAVYSHGSKGLFVKPSETEECINILDEMLGDL